MPASQYVVSDSSIWCAATMVHHTWTYLNNSVGVYRYTSFDTVLKALLCAISAYLCFGPRIHSHHKCTKCRPKILVSQTAFVINQVLAKNMSVNADSCYAQQLSTVETCRNKIYNWEFNNFSYKQLCLESKNHRSTAEKLLVHDGTWPWNFHRFSENGVIHGAPMAAEKLHWQLHLHGLPKWSRRIYDSYDHIISFVYICIFNIFCYHMNWYDMKMMIIMYLFYNNYIMCTIVIIVYGRWNMLKPFWGIWKIPKLSDFWCTVDHSSSFPPLVVSSWSSS